MDLKAYLDRIGFAGEPRPDLATLSALHRAHLMAIPYESLDVQLGRPLTPDPDAAFEKIVVRRRGGWCYEMNGLFGLALEAIGFRVTRLAGGVMREVLGDVQVGNHLVLRVDLDRPWIADVGFGDGTLEPFPLQAGPFRLYFLQLRSQAAAGGARRLQVTHGPRRLLLLGLEGGLCHAAGHQDPYPEEQRQRPDG